MTALTGAARGGKLGGIVALGTVAVVAMGVLGALAAQQPLLAAAFPIFAGIGYALYKLPLRAGVMGVLFLVLALEGLQDPLGPEHLWDVPLLGDLAYASLYNLSSVTGVGFLRAPLVDVMTLMLFALSMARHPRDGWAGTQPTVRAMHMALWASAGCAVALMVLGAVQGGDTNEMLWQARHVVMFPVRAVVVMRALDCTNDELKMIGKLAVVAALVKAVVGLWFFYVVAPASGIELEFTTSHTDTLLFVPVLAMFLAKALEAKSLKAAVAGLPWAALVFWGMVANDRRVSYVSLCIGAVVMLVMSNATPMKRVLGRALLLAAPVIPFYVLAGWATDGKGLFFPVGILKSLVVGDTRHEGSVDYRDLENLDVLQTWSQHQLLPAGFGHKFDLLFPLPDISGWFTTWQFHPHNSYLWFMTIGGPVGFTLIFLPQVATLYLAARAYRHATDPTQRIALLTAIVTVIAFFNQVWGDMGTLSWTVSWTAAVAAAVSAKLAMKTGAWPAVFRIKREHEQEL